MTQLELWCNIPVPIYSDPEPELKLHSCSNSSSGFGQKFQLLVLRLHRPQHRLKYRKNIEDPLQCWGTAFGPPGTFNTVIYGATGHATAHWYPVLTQQNQYHTSVGHLVHPIGWTWLILHKFSENLYKIIQKLNIFVELDKIYWAWRWSDAGGAHTQVLFSHTFLMVSLHCSWLVKLWSTGFSSSKPRLSQRGWGRERY